MSQAALIRAIEQIISGKHDPVAAIVQSERDRGFKVIRPGDAPWFRAMDWRYTSVASIDGNTARLVLLHAFEEGKGAFTRTIAGINAAGLRPAVIEPTSELADTLGRKGWRGQSRGRSFETRETVWRPK